MATDIDKIMGIDSSKKESKIDVREFFITAGIITVAVLIGLVIINKIESIRIPISNPNNSK
jgi:hypothetical protein